MMKTKCLLYTSDHLAYDATRKAYTQVNKPQSHSCKDTGATIGNDDELECQLHLSLLYEMLVEKRKSYQYFFSILVFP